jgi:hypothetical protein
VGIDSDSGEVFGGVITKDDLESAFAGRRRYGEDDDAA